MKLSTELSKIFEEELERDLTKEQEKKEFLSQESFESCGARSEAILKAAYDRVNKVLTNAIINHREKDHEEDHSKERAVNEVSMSTQDIEASARTWWN